MNYLPSISLLASLAVIASAGTGLASFEGRLGQVAQDAFSATRVAVPEPSAGASRLPPVDIPSVAPAPALRAEGASLVSATVPPLARLEPVSAPAGSTLITPAGHAALLQGIASATNDPVHGLMLAMMPKGFEASATISSRGMAGSNVTLPVVAMQKPTISITGDGLKGKLAELPFRKLDLSNLVPSGPYKPIPSAAIAALSLKPPSANGRLPRIALSPGPALPSGFAALAAARLVRDGLLEGSLNPRNPEWRPHLALLLEDPANAVSADFLFDTLLAGCAGHDDRARMAAVETWANSYENGRFAETIAYGAARHAFASGNMPTTAARCERLIAEFPKIADRGMLLLALVQAQTDDTAKALTTLRDLQRLHPDSPAAPEARFMEAWIALQEARNEDAIGILTAIVDETPRAPAAAKASQMLASLKGTK